MTNKNDWRYVPYTPEALDSINYYDPEDTMIEAIDSKRTQEEDIGFSFHSLIEDKNKLLTKKQKLVLYLRIVEGKTFAQIGKECKTSRQNCFEIYNKALTRLKENTSWLSSELLEEE